MIVKMWNLGETEVEGRPVRTRIWVAVWHFLDKTPEPHTAELCGQMP